MNRWVKTGTSVSQVQGCAPWALLVAWGDSWAPAGLRLLHCVWLWSPKGLGKRSPPVLLLGPLGFQEWH